VQLKVGGKFLLKLNISKRPIANKYCEVKMKSTSKGELKGLEIAEREGNGSDGTAPSSVKRNGGRCQHHFTPGKSV